jgi:hypothetical protein
MRIILIVFLSLLFVSCELDLNDDNIHFEKIPAFNIQIPDNMIVDFEYDISLDYALPNGCYEFYEIGIEGANGNITDSEIQIVPYAQVQSNSYCTQIYTEDTCSFSFKPTQTGIYILKFWIGETNSGIDQFEEYELIIE